MKQYYDPEYDKIVDETVPKQQFDWFRKQSWFHKTYKEFLANNFMSPNGTPIGSQPRT